MTEQKKILVYVSINDDYAKVSECTKGMASFHRLVIRSTTKRNLPFVLLKQALPPYTKIRIRLDKLGINEDTKHGIYEFYYEE